MNYKVLFSYYNLISPVDLVVNITNGSNGRTMTTRVDPGTGQKVIFQDDFTGSVDQDYLVNVYSTNSELHINQNVPVKYTMKDVVVFIQTDKPIYSPGQNVLLRVLLLDLYLKPYDRYSIEDLRVYIKVNLLQFIL